MKHVSAAEANRNFSRLLGQVGDGEEFVITSHGKPVARLIPASDASERAARNKLFEEFFKDLRSRPVLNLPRVTRDEIYDYLNE
jgi:prevent-host-death family protein